MNDDFFNRLNQFLEAFLAPSRFLWLLGFAVLMLFATFLGPLGLIVMLAGLVGVVFYIKNSLK